MDRGGYFLGQRTRKVYVVDYFLLDSKDDEGYFSVRRMIILQSYHSEEDMRWYHSLNSDEMR